MLTIIFFILFIFLLLWLANIRLGWANKKTGDFLLTIVKQNQEDISSLSLKDGTLEERKMVLMQKLDAIEARTRALDEKSYGKTLLYFYFGLDPVKAFKKDKRESIRKVFN